MTVAKFKRAALALACLAGAAQAQVEFKFATSAGVR
jgi:hypothetical protein